MEKTAVEYFFHELQRMQYFIGNDMLEAYKQAKEMEKQQIIDTYDTAKYLSSGNNYNGEKYYKDTFSN